MNLTSARDFLLHSLSKERPFSAAFRQALIQEFTLRSVVKRQRVKEPGGINRYLYVVAEGLLKGVYEYEGREGIIWFAREGQLALLPDSFFKQTPTDEYIEAVEDCQLFRLSFEQLQCLCRRFPEMERLVRGWLEQQLINAAGRERMRRHAAPQERLRHFKQFEPALAIRLRRYEIADYLHISRSTPFLSAVRISWEQ